MDDLTATIGAILNDPAKMEQLRSVAQSMGLNTGGTPPAQQNQTVNQTDNFSQNTGFDPSAISNILQNFQNIMPSMNNAPSQSPPSPPSPPPMQDAPTDLPPSSPPAPANNSALPSLDTVSKIAGIMGTFNQSDKNVELLRSLKPHFSAARAGRIDDAVRLLQLMRAWPALRDSGLLGSLGNLSGLSGLSGLGNLGGLGNLFTGGGNR